MDAECKGLLYSAWVCGRALPGIAGSNPAERRRCLSVVNVVCINLLKTKRRPFYLKIQSVPRSKHFSSYAKHRLLHLKTQSVPCSKHFSSYTNHRLLYLKTQSVPSSKHFSSYTKHILLYLKAQSVPRSKHFPSRL
jgi:hypothetical protein